MSNKIDSKEVELFLLDNLDFFETRESLVSELKFKHSDSSASSLLERQILKLRGEQKNLMDLLSSFIETASLNEDLFNKSKNLILSILDSSSREEVVETVQKDFKESFNVNNCILEFLNNEEIDALEKTTEISIHCGSFSKQKMDLLFSDSKVESMAIAVLISEKEIGLLKLGSYDRTRYLGDEDTTFIEYIRDVLEKKINSFEVDV